jgi:hypothetical protein
MPGPLRLVLSIRSARRSHAVPSCGTLVSSSARSPRSTSMVAPVGAPTLASTLFSRPISVTHSVSVCVDR